MKLTLFYITIVFSYISFVESQPSCGNCTEPILRLLKEVEQDISYARGAIDEERVSSKLLRELDELESTYDDHRKGFYSSVVYLNNSINNLSRRVDANSTILSSSLIDKVVRDLEQELKEVENTVIDRSLNEFNSMLQLTISRARELLSSFEKINRMFKDYYLKFGYLSYNDIAQMLIRDTDGSSQVLDKARGSLCAQANISRLLKNKLYSKHQSKNSSNEKNLGSVSFPSLRFIEDLYDSLRAQLDSLPDVADTTTRTDTRLRKSLNALKNRVRHISMSIGTPKSLTRSHGQQSNDRKTPERHDSILGALQVIL